MKIVTISPSVVLFALLLAPMASGPAAAQRDYALINADLFDKNVRYGGAADGGGGDFSGEIDFGDGRICYYFEVYDIAGADAAHIHQAAQGETGPAVLTLAVPDAEAEDEVCVEADETLLRAIAANPEGYYVDIHTPAFAEAALRGQLHE